MNGAESAALIAPASASLRSAGVEGFIRPFTPGSGDGRSFLRCAGRACDGAMLDLILDRARARRFHHRRHPDRPAACSDGAGPGAAGEKRAAQYGPDSTITIGRVRLPAN